MPAPITLMPGNCKMDADFSSLVASNATLCPRSQDTPGSNGHISLAACPAALTCLPVSKPPLSTICAPHRLHPINLSSGAKSKALLAFHHFPGRTADWHSDLSKVIASSERQINHNAGNFPATDIGGLNIQKIVTAALCRRVCS
jgi:hypothetical protein